MKAKELRELSDAELEKKLRDSSDELVRLRVNQQVGNVENPTEIRNLRRTIARIQTLLNEKRAAATA